MGRSHCEQDLARALYSNRQFQFDHCPMALTENSWNMCNALNRRGRRGFMMPMSNGVMSI